MRRRRAEGEDGSTIVELLVAAGVSVIALGVALGGVLPAMRALGDAHRDDHGRIELDTAGDIVARVIRAARPDAMRSAVTGDDRTLVVALGPGRTARILLDAGDLSLDVEGDPTGSLGLPAGLLAEGIDMEGSGFALLDPSGAASESEAAPAAIVVNLVRGEDAVVRAVPLRLRTHLDGATPW